MRRSLRSALKSAQSTESCWIQCRRAISTTPSRLGWMQLTTFLTTSVPRYPPSRCLSKCNITHTWFTSRTLLPSQCEALTMATSNAMPWVTAGPATSQSNKWEEAAFKALLPNSSSRSKCITRMARLVNCPPILSKLQRHWPLSSNHPLASLSLMPLASLTWASTRTNSSSSKNSSTHFTSSWWMRNWSARRLAAN